MDKKKQIFETMPVPKAVASLAVPTILGQLITMIYNLADTLYIGQTGNPYMVAAISISFVQFFMLNALGNLFGIGGGSLISRLLGAGQPERSETSARFPSGRASRRRSFTSRSYGFSWTRCSGSWARATTRSATRGTT
jgi:Na+-driven multidrug efflux pump